jgi:hypothetical protein
MPTKLITSVPDDDPQSPRANLWQGEHKTTNSHNITPICFVQRHPWKPRTEHVRNGMV